jgi:hypothetical protein
MKNHRILVYAAKWLAFVFLAYLSLKEDHSGIGVLLLIVFVSAMLIWEGFRDFKTKFNETNSSGY